MVEVVQLATADDAALIIRAGGLTLDAGRLEADVGRGPVPLTRLEFLLLKELASRPGMPVPKNVLLAAVWGYHSGPGSNVVDVCVRRLRAKLGFGLIKTVRGEGYQLVEHNPAIRPAPRLPPAPQPPARRPRLNGQGGPGGPR